MLIAVVVGSLAATMDRWRPRSAASPANETGHWAAVFRGRSFLDQNRPDLALQTVANIRDSEPGAGEAMCVAGVSLARMQQIRSARFALERALKLQPRQPIAVKTLAAIYLSLGDTDRGLENLKKATELSPKDPRPWSAMGRVYLDMGLMEEAASAFNESLKRDPSQPDAGMGRIEALLASGHGEDAGPLVARLLQLDPDNPKLLGLAAHQARDAGQVDEALAFVERALAHDPEEIEALMTRARLRYAAGQDVGALADLDRVATVNPNLLAGLTLKLQVESRMGLAGRASETAVTRKRATERLALMEEITRLIAANPEAAEPRCRLGQVAAEGSQWDLAANCFHAALALDPKYRPASEGLASLDAAKRRKDIEKSK